MQSRNLKAVQKFLGHPSIQTTADIYTDWDIEQLADTLLEVLDAIFRLVPAFAAGDRLSPSHAFSTAAEPRSSSMSSIVLHSWSVGRIRLRVRRRRVFLKVSGFTPFALQRPPSHGLGYRPARRDLARGRRRCVTGIVPHGCGAGPHR
jgi:hypothetical protein